MHISLKQALLFVLLAGVSLIVNSSVVYANSPPPPTISILVYNAPKDLELSIGSNKAFRNDKIFESYFTFHLGITDVNYETLKITRGGSTFEIALPQLKRYNNIFTLDLENRTLNTGTSRVLPYGLAAITIVLTLLIEGLLFFLFGYRKRSSWTVFLITNIVTQGLLYVWLNAEFYPVVDGYYFPVILSLIGGEFLVFISEIIIFLIFVRERPRWITSLYVIAANFSSLVVGGLITNYLI